jgi:signal transduction histidine kinase
MTMWSPSSQPTPYGAASGAGGDRQRALLTALDAERRLHLLRLILPALFGVAAVAVPFAIMTDISSGSWTSVLQVGVGLVAFAVGIWGVLTRRANLASVSLFVGVTGVIVYLLLSDGPLRGTMDTWAVPPFSLFVLSIAISGIFGQPWQVLATTGMTSLFSLLVMLLTPRSAALTLALSQPDGLSLFTVTIAAQLAVGILMFGATTGFVRMQRALADVQLAYEQERELDRLKDQFISSVNHELRTPIMALQGYLELARELGTRGDSQRQEQMLVRGTEAADHVAGIVKAVLNVRNVDVDTKSLHLAPCPLAPIVVEASRLIDPRVAGDAVRPLHLRIPPELIVYADEERVRQVVLNLLSNAVKYSSPESPIEISAEEIDAQVEPHMSGFRWLARKPHRVARVAVRDYGLGVPPEQAGLLFGRFVRLERDIASPVVGTGLGLALSRSFVEAMGGKIWVESTGVAGEGSTFYFTLPLNETDEHTATGANRRVETLSDTN